MILTKDVERRVSKTKAVRPSPPIHLFLFLFFVDKVRKKRRKNNIKEKEESTFILIKDVERPCS